MQDDERKKLAEFRERYSERYSAKEKNELLIRRRHPHRNDLRGEFQRDRDRIIHSRAFRRLSQKTQVFNSTKGDHYRTRLTHSLEVSQISRSIGSSLGLNEALIEAISLGHDLGHTPFGHIIERTLHDIIKNNELENMGTKVIGGFKHNFQSLHLLENIEMGNGIERGLNVTLAVKDGIIKHTGREIKSYINKREEEVHYEVLDLKYPNINLLDYKDSITLEGQVVALADEIAQSTHDLEDGFRSRIIKFEDFIKELLMEMEKAEGTLKEHGKENEYVIEVLTGFKDDIANINKKNSDLSQKMGFLIRGLINILVTDALYNSMRNIENDRGRSIEESGVIKARLINNSEGIINLREYLTGYIFRHVVSSQEVSQLDSKAKYLIKQIFKAYYADPRQLPDYSLERYYNKKGKKLDRTIINNEIKFLQDDPEFIRLICDHIAGMTDVYAVQEYNNLYGMNYYI